MKKLIAFLLIVFAVSGCDFDSRTFVSANNVIPNSNYKWHKVDSTLLYK